MVELVGMRSRRGAGGRRSAMRGDVLHVSALLALSGVLKPSQVPRNMVVSALKVAGSCVRVVLEGALLDNLMGRPLLATASASSAFAGFFILANSTLAAYAGGSTHLSQGSVVFGAFLAADSPAPTTAPTTTAVSTTAPTTTRSTAPVSEVFKRFTYRRDTGVDKRDCNRTRERPGFVIRVRESAAKVVKRVSLSFFQPLASRGSWICSAWMLASSEGVALRPFAVENGALPIALITRMDSCPRAVGMIVATLETTLNGVKM